MSLSGPGFTSLVQPDQLVSEADGPNVGERSLGGSFVLTIGAQNNTILTFTPNQALRPDTDYQVMMVGASNNIGAVAISNLTGELLGNNYLSTFHTLVQVLVPPAAGTSIPWELQPGLNPEDITVTAMRTVGNDLTQVITMRFPAAIDSAWFAANASLFQASLEAILEDPNVVVPTGLTITPTLNGNTLVFTITGWPPES